MIIHTLKIPVSPCPMLDDETVNASIEMQMAVLASTMPPLAVAKQPFLDINTVTANITVEYSGSLDYRGATIVVAWSSNFK